MVLNFNRFSIIINSQQWKNAISTGNFYRIRREEVGQLSRDIFRPVILRYFLSACKRPVD